jgi:hypothetical protein
MTQLDEGSITSIDLSNSGISNIATYDGNSYIDTTALAARSWENSTEVYIEGPLNVQGRNVLEELDEMRDILLLLRRDVDMEKKYPRLKELKEEYERTLEKYKTFESLRGKK